jgi:hypothetical protein
MKPISNRKKRLVLDVTYHDKASLDLVLNEIRNRVIEMGEIKIKRNEAVLHGRLTFELPFQEPKIEIIDGEKHMIFKSNFE